MKILLAMLLCLQLLLPGLGCADSAATPSPLPADVTEVAAPAELVTARYNLRATPAFVSEEATLRVFDNGTSEMALRFTNAYGQAFNMPDGAIIRMTKVEGEEGYYAQAPLTLTGKNRSHESVFSAVVPIDRAFGKSKNITFYICKADGTQLKQLRYTLDTFDCEGGQWPTPESTPELPTMPPIQPTPLPTPLPSIAPGTTEPPHDSAVLTIPFIMREYTQAYTELNAQLRIYPNQTSALTLQFKYGKEIPEGTVFRLTMVDGKLGFFGEGMISPADENGVREAVLLFNQQVGPMNNLNLEAFVPGQQNRLFKAFYKRSGKVPDAWYAMDQILTTSPSATPAPTHLPQGASPTPQPTEPSESQASSHTHYALLDPVKRFSLKSAIHQRYDNGLSMLTVSFRYTGELPAKPLMRIVQKEFTAGNFGEAIVTRDEDDKELLTVAILTDQLQGNLRAFRLKCYDEKENELFFADFCVSIYGGNKSSGTDVSIARAMLPSATPEPAETPVPTPTIAPTADPDTSPTPAPEEPDYSQARHKRKFLLLDKVKGYSHYNVTLRRYEDVDVLTVYFRYHQDLPEGAKLRLVRVDTLLDDFGEAPILPSELKNASADLLCAKIPSDRIPLNCIGLRVEAVTADGDVLFTADFYPEEGNQAKTARELLKCEFEEPTATPEAETE